MNPNGYDAKAMDDVLFGEVRRLDAVDLGHSLRLTDALGRLVGIENTQMRHGLQLDDIQRKQKGIADLLARLCEKWGILP